MTSRIPAAGCRDQFVIILIAGLLTACQGTSDSPAPAPEAASPKTSTQTDGIRETPITIGTTLHLESTILGDTRQINVWLPPSHGEGDQRYPVLYLIDGALDQDFHHISGLAQLPTVNGLYEELIVVGIQTRTRMMELTHEPSDPRYIRDPPESGKSAEFLEFIRSEVIPLIESRYRVAERRVLIGESLAGLFVTEVFLKHPDAFTDYISVSPSLWWDDKALAKASAELIAAHDDAKRHLYLTMADEGGTMKVGLDMLLAALEENPPAGLTLHYVDRSRTETHASIYHSAAFDALRKLFDLPPIDYGEPPWYLVEGGQPPPAEDTNDDG